MQLPLPPHELQAVVAGQNVTDELFVEQGALAIPIIRDAVARAGDDLARFDAILEWGCGVGRILRHWPEYPEVTAEIHGCDVNAELVAWCQANLPTFKVIANGQKAKLSYPSDMFDLVYASSVFTHLSEKAHHTWMREIRRVLKPGGFFFFTTHGETFKRLLTPEELDAWNANGLVTRRTVPRRPAGRFRRLRRAKPRAIEGSNRVATFHPPKWVQGFIDANGMLLVEHGPDDAAFVSGQDWWLTRKPR